MMVLVIDFGAQYAQLIARRIREAQVYSEIAPHTTPVAALLAREPAAIVLVAHPDRSARHAAEAIEPAPSPVTVALWYRGIRVGPRTAGCGETGSPRSTT